MDVLSQYTREDLMALSSTELVELVLQLQRSSSASSDLPQQTKITNKRKRDSEDEGEDGETQPGHRLTVPSSHDFLTSPCVPAPSSFLQSWMISLSLFCPQYFGALFPALTFISFFASPTLN